MRRRTSAAVDPDDLFVPGESPTPPQPRWRRGPTRHRVVAVALTLALVGGAAAGLLWWRNGGADSVPVQRPEVTYGLRPLDPGQKFSMGSMLIANPRGDVEILEVVPNASPNVEFLGAITVWPRDFRSSNLAFGPGFPAPEQRRHHPALGVVVPRSEFDFVYPDGTTSQAMFVTAGFRIVDGDVGAVNGVTLVYRDGGQVKREHFRHAIVACVKPNPCKSSEPNPPVDFDDQVLYRFGLIPRPSGLNR